MIEKKFWVKPFFLLLGPILCAIFLHLPPPEGLQPEAWKVIACAVWMITWWLTEAVPIPVTALLPLVLFPTLAVSDIQKAAAPYSNPIVFLFLGGFMIALAMEKWGLHLRIALNIIRLIGTGADRLVLGFMMATGLISMWISNTATTVMMLPIALSVVDLLKHDIEKGIHPQGHTRFFTSLMLGIAYAASIGGMGTLVGTPPNMIFAGFMRETYGYNIHFADWAIVGIPLSLLLLFLTWLLLTKLLFRSHLGQLHGSKELIEKELAALGPLHRGELSVLIVFVMTAVLWIFSPYLKHFLPGDITENGVAVFSAILMFVIPVNLKKGEFILDWKTAERLPWGILLLFGGGMSLADALGNTGVVYWIGDIIATLQGIDIAIIILVIVALVVILSEFMSNMALTAIFLPVAGALAIGFGENPLLVTIPVTLAASIGFMLPMATPPNAIVFASGHVTIPHMVRAGFLLDILCILIIAFFAWTVIPSVLDIKMGVVPDWAVVRH